MDLRLGSRNPAHWVEGPAKFSAPLPSPENKEREMLKEFLEQRREARAIKLWQKSLLGRTLAEHTRQYFNNPRLAGFNEEVKSKIIGDFYENILSLAQAEPFIAMRELLASYVTDLSSCKFYV